MLNNKVAEKQPDAINKSIDPPKHQLRLGYLIFGTLVGIKLLEYLISKMVKVGNWSYLLILALTSAWIIAYYYKHIRQLWHSGGQGNE